MAGTSADRERRNGFKRLALVSVVVSPELEALVRPAIDAGVSTEFCSRLFAQDPTLWGQEAESEASVRLGWVSDPLDYSSLIDTVEELRSELVARGMRRVILCAMGGSSLAPEVMARAFDFELIILDTIHPDVLTPVVSSALADAVVVVSSKSGSTVETDSLRRIFSSAMTAQGVDPLDRIIVVTDPGSPLEIDARQAGLRVFLGNPDVGGRFSALTAFGLVPAVLAGVPVREVLTSAHTAWTRLRKDEPTNAGLVLGAALAAGSPARNKVLLAAAPSTPGFGNWIEQLVAESTGKHGVGLLPVVGSPLTSIPDGITVGPAGSATEITVEAPIGELFLLWEVATAFACQILGVNPFDQPNVESAKVAARELLDSDPAPRGGERDFGHVSAWSSPVLESSVTDVPGALKWLLQRAESSSYIALGVFGPGGANEGPWRTVAHALEKRSNRPVTLGFGPRFLHSTGQFHKGGPAEGLFVQVIVLPESDLEIPGRFFSSTDLLLAQAHGDASVIANSSQPALSLSTSGENIMALCDAIAAAD